MPESREAALKKALACEMHAREAPDELLRGKFWKLRDSWLRIANAIEMKRAVALGTTSIGSVGRTL